MQFAPNFFGGGGGEGEGGITPSDILAAFKADPDFGATGLLADANEINKVPRLPTAVAGGAEFTHTKVLDLTNALTERYS